MHQKNSSRIIVALDHADDRAVYELIDKITPDLCRLKIGKEMFVRYGPTMVKNLVSRNFDVFLDLKFHDIPSTVAGACSAAADLGVWMLNVHAQGGQRMLEAARNALQSCRQRPLLIGVTLLTSIEDQDLQAIGIGMSAAEWVLKLALLTRQAGLDGVVCSAQEATLLRQKTSTDFKLITPGIRPSGASQQDQKRVMTPIEAIMAGSDYLVIGRPVTQAADPVVQLRTINSEIDPVP